MRALQQLNNEKGKNDMVRLKAILSQDETIEWKDSPNQQQLFIQVAVTAFLVFVVGILIRNMGAIECTVNDVPDICHPSDYVSWGYLAVGAMIAWYYFSMRVTTYYITNKRLLIESGLIGRDFKSIQYEQIQACDIDVGLLGKILDTGSIVIDTGKVRRTKDGSEPDYDKFSCIAAPYKAYQVLQEKLDAYKQNMYQK